MMQQIGHGRTRTLGAGLALAVLASAAFGQSEAKNAEPGLHEKIAAPIRERLDAELKKHAAAAGQEKAQTATPDQGRQVSEAVHEAIDAARDRVFPALVNIQVVTVSYWGGKEQKNAATGSGTIVSPEGLVVTNQHVVNDGRSFRVTLSDKREVPATLVGEDPLTDLAVLRIKMDELGSAPLPGVAVWGDSNELAVGDSVLAMGAPFGLSRSVTLGIVSNTERVFSSISGDDIADQEFDADFSSDIFTRWIQHDALINPGNSGGPLVNLKGEVVGVNTRGGAGMGFANPSDLARRVAEELIKSGEVTRSTVGVAFKSVKRAGLQEGVLVNSVDADGPAAQAGIKAGDILLTLDGQPINARFPEEIPVVLRAIAQRPVGSSIDVTYRRDGQTGSAKVTTQRLLKERGDETALRLFGITASSITEKMARAHLLGGTDGAFVLGARQGGPANLAEPSITSRDVILAVNDVEVKTLDDLVSEYKKIAAMDPLPEFVTIRFDRRGKDHLTLIKPRPEKKEDPPRELPKAWIGVATQPVLRNLAKQIGLGDQLGFRVTRVYPGTLAESAGLQTGDIVTAINGEKVSPRGMQDIGLFQRKVRTLSIGEEATLSVIRDGEPADLKVALERTRLTPEEALRDENRDFEITVRELTFFDRDDNRWDDSVQGVLVEGGEQAGWAGLAGVYPGDVIQRVNEAPITDLASWRRAMEAVAKAQPERVTFVVLRGKRTQFKFAEPEWKPVVDQAAAQQTK